MIKKFISLDNIGRFHNYRCKGDIDFRKVNLLYAGNGFGKTTLCAVLRSVQEGNPNLLFERKTLGKEGDPEVQIKCDGGVVKFIDGAWDKTIPNIALFDKTFIHENVFTGDSIDHEHRRNLYRVIVGKHGVELARKVEELNEKIKKTNPDLKIKEDAVKIHIPQGMDIEEFINLSKDEDIDAHISSKVSEIRSYGDSGAILNTSLLETIDIPTFPEKFQQILVKTFDDVSRDAETPVKKHVVKYQLGGDEWISNGLKHIHDDTCPFCEQNIEDSSIIRAYRGYFNLAYRSFIKEVELLNKQVQDDFSDHAILDLREVIKENERLIEFWKKHIKQLNAPDIDFECDVYKPLHALCLGAISLASKKRQAPSDAVFFDDAFLKLQQQAYNAKEVTKIYNKTIEMLNQRIQKMKDAIASGNLKETEKILWNFQAVKKRYTPQIMKVVEDYKVAKKAKETLEEEKIRAKEELDQYSETMIVEYQEEINKLLDRFNPEFRIANAGRDYRGGVPRSNYQLLINDTTVELSGNDRKPCFKNTLSSGDRSTLALALFLAKLEQDPDIGSKVVVLDDPFTSLDRFRRNCTRDLIRILADKAGQVIVLSHDPHFLHIIWDQLPTRNMKTLQLSKVGKTVTITEWDIEEEMKNPYFKQHDSLTSFICDGVGGDDLLSIATIIRPVVEGWLRYGYPNKFAPKEMLGGMIKKIQEAEGDKTISPLKYIFDDLYDIKEYTNKYHHNQINISDNEPIDQTELEGYVKRTLNLMGGY